MVPATDLITDPIIITTIIIGRDTAMAGLIILHRVLCLTAAGIIGTTGTGGDGETDVTATAARPIATDKPEGSERCKGQVRQLENGKSEKG